MAVIKLVLVVCAMVSPALSRPAIGPYNYNYNTAYNPAFNPAYNTGAYNPAYNYNNGYTPGDTFDPHPRYNYEYRVAEPRTGDYKSAQESREGDAVRGSYSVAEPDGSLLTVRYAANDATGYTAVVERSGPGGTVVNHFPGAAPSAVAPIYNTAYNGVSGAYNGVSGAYNGVPGAYAGAYPKGYGAPGYAAPGYAGPVAGHPGFNAGYAGLGTTSTSFAGPHASYSY